MRKSPRYEVSIAICAAHQNKGIASAALGWRAASSPAPILEAEILPANGASIELFRRAGYTPASRDPLSQRACTQSVFERSDVSERRR